MSKSRPFFLSSSSLRMIGTRNEPFDGGARPPAPDLFTCAQACPDRRMAGDRTAPTPKARTIARRDHLRELIHLSISASDISGTETETIRQARFVGVKCLQSVRTRVLLNSDISASVDAKRLGRRDPFAPATGYSWKHLDAA